MLKTIDRDALRKKLQESPGRTRLIDVRDRHEYEAGHIKGAISIPAHELPIRAEEYFGKEVEVIVYCANFECKASENAARMLDEKGFVNVLDYEGGLRDWKAAGFLTEGAGNAKAA